MSKKWIIDLILFIVMTSVLVYSIVTHNNNGFAVSAVWSVFYLIEFICDLKEKLSRPERLDREAKEKWEELFGNKGE